MRVSQRALLTRICALLLILGHIKLIEPKKNAHLICRTVPSQTFVFFFFMIIPGQERSYSHSPYRLLSLSRDIYDFLLVFLGTFEPLEYLWQPLASSVMGFLDAMPGSFSLFLNFRIRVHASLKALGTG
jgi:hypothetical protein